MRLELLPTGSEDCPLLRLFDFSPDEAHRLQSVIHDLASGRVERVAVHALQGILSIDGCELVFISTPHDHGIAQVEENKFECRFSRDTWDNIDGLIDPFTCKTEGWQWLAQSAEGIALLLSPSGQW